jgi:hypothetical protein
MSQMDVKAAFDILQVELKRMLDELKWQGSESFQHSQYDKVKNIGERCKELQGFIDEVQSMIIAWNKYDAPVPYSILVSEVKGSSLQPTDVHNPSAGEDNPSISKRAVRGRKLRELFLDKLAGEGIRLTLEKGVHYHTAPGKKVGIASASKINEKWFLGLPIQPYDYIVLLCQEENGNLREFIFDTPFVTRVVEKLSHTETDYKFHIKRDGGSYIFELEGGEQEIIDRYLSAYDNLR